MIIQFAFNVIRLAELSIYLAWCIVTGKGLVKFLEISGPFFIKFGQTLSSRPDLFDEKTLAKLLKLCDKLPPFSTSQVFKTIKRDFSVEDINLLFKEFSIKPVAAASVAQVHRAITVDGQVVAVKVLRPRIKQKFERDIRLLRFLAKLFERYAGNKINFKPLELVDFFATSVNWELDLRYEAAAASELKDNFIDDSSVYVPEVFWHLTSHNILTMEWIEATSISDKASLINTGHNLKEIAAKIAIAFFKQTYKDGFFHADMHPGNIMVNAKGQIVLLDFGIMGRIDEPTRYFLARIIRGFLQRDYLNVAKAHIEAGFVPATTNLHQFAQACRCIGEPIVGLPVSQISLARLLSQLFKIAHDFQMRAEPNVMLLQKAMIMVEGIGSSLDIDVNMWYLIEPWIEDWYNKNFTIDAKIKNKVIDLISRIALNLSAGLR
jgi:ubiquinone biosynthesis protein